MYKKFESQLYVIRMIGENSTYRDGDVKLSWKKNADYEFLFTFSPVTFLNQMLTEHQYNTEMAKYFNHDHDDFPYQFFIQGQSPIQKVAPTKLKDATDGFLLLEYVGSANSAFNDALEINPEKVLIKKYFAQRQDRFKSALAKVWKYDDVANTDKDLTLTDYLYIIGKKQLELLNNKEYNEALYINKALKLETKLEVAPKYFLRQLWTEHKYLNDSLDVVVETAKDVFEVELDEGDTKFAEFISEDMRKKVLQYRY